eukprot:TRINITY_DN2969_c0_g1_i1.p1 TRINITY_DN2969_c0_g1~~TRINITY_DN2969_c0_g1_i1.p1  ORF type:complete len:318 (-),score=40.04 TRINITY_DN2969_c0_g1_i1:245-1090(-)
MNYGGASLVPACQLLSFERDVLTTLGHTLLWGVIIYLTFDTKKRPHVPNKYKLTLFDHILGLSTISCLVVNMGVRYIRGVIHWAIQPCHVLTLLLAIVIYDRQSRMTPFRYYFYFMWMPFFGLVNADYSWFTYSFEIPLFYIHHALLLLVPYYYLFTRRYHTEDLIFHPEHSDKFGWKGRASFLLKVYGICMLYHAYMLIWAGHYFDEDFNGMRCLPGALSFAGAHWREVMVALGIHVIFILSFIPESICYLLWNKQREWKKAKGARKTISISVGSEKKAA